MTDPASNNERPNDEQPDDEALLRFLDGYVQELQAGHRPERSSLPLPSGDAAELLDCLESLEMLAGPRLSAEPWDSADARNPPPTLEGLPGSPVESHPFAFSAIQQFPREFGDYELLGELGRGGMGVVYQARQRKLQRIVALKLIPAGLWTSSEAGRRLLEEARAAAAVRHPRIVTLYEVGEVHGQPYLAMEYVPGRSLADRLEAGPWTPTAAAEVLLPIAEAVDALHRRSLIHRDLKPSNILLDEAGQPFVSDFGLAQMVHGPVASKERSLVVGTPSYMPPEQAAGRWAAIGPRSDVYSLGAILYECLTGRPPFRASSVVDTLLQVLEREPTTPRQLRPDVPPALEAICLKCLEKDPAARYGSAAELAADLERFLHGEVVAAQPATWARRVRNWVSRQPALAARLGGLTLCLVIVQSKYVLRPESSPWEVHLQVLLVLSGWLIVSALFQQLLDRGWHPAAIKRAWSAADTCALTAVLLLGQAPPGPPLIGYALLISGAGFWFETSIVFFATICCFVGYVIYAGCQPDLLIWWHYHAIFCMSLLILGATVAHQVHRVRVLSRYYQSHRIG